MSVKPSNGFEWPGVELKAYKDTPGSHSGVTRRLLSMLPAGAETRYFEVGIGGYTSFERHEHEHMVIVIRGAGEVQLGDEVTPVEPFDVVEVPSHMPHQFRDTGEEPFGFLCVVSAVRDRPVLVNEVSSSEQTSSPTFAREREADTAGVAERQKS